MSDAKLLQDIENRVRPTICETFNSRGGMSIEGRITKTDVGPIGLWLGTAAATFYGIFILIGTIWCLKDNMRR